MDRADFQRLTKRLEAAAPLFKELDELGQFFNDLVNNKSEPIFIGTEHGTFPDAWKSGVPLDPSLREDVLVLLRKQMRLLSDKLQQIEGGDR